MWRPSTQAAWWISGAFVYGWQAALVSGAELSGSARYDGRLQGKIIVRAWVSTPGNRALQLDGKTGCLRTDLTDLSGSALTIQYWFKGSSMASAVRQQNGRMEDFAEEWSGRATDKTATPRHGWVVAGWNSFHILSHDGLLNGIQYDPVVTDGNWHHVVMTWKQNTRNGFASYLDGQLFAQRDSRDNPIPNYKCPVYFGSYDGKFEFARGMLDEIAIWKRFFTEAEISNSWNTALKGNEPGLIGLWNFDTNGLVDSSSNHYHGFLQGGASLVEAEIPGLNSPVCSVQLSKPGHYVLSNLVDGADYHVTAFLDVNGNGNADPWEPQSRAKAELIHVNARKMTLDLTLGIPVPFWRSDWFIGLGGVGVVGIAAAALRLIERAKMRKRMDALERQNELERERSRIARDIHDELGAKLTRICYLSEAAKAGASPFNASELDTLSHASHQLLRTLDAVVWIVNPKNDTLEHLVEYAAQYAEEFFQMTKIKCQVDIPLDIPDRAVTSQIRHNILRVVQEGLSNVLKHAEAKSITLRFEARQTGLQITMDDDGRGFDPDDPADARPWGGHGLAFMRERMAEIGGTVRVQGNPGRGTQVSLWMPFSPVA